MELSDAEIILHICHLLHSVGIGFWLAVDLTIPDFEWTAMGICNSLRFTISFFQEHARLLELLTQVQLEIDAVQVNHGHLMLHVLPCFEITAM